MKTIFDLPEDLVEAEILSRVSLTSLRSVRSTCKKWNTLSKNRILFGKAAKKQFLMMDSRRVCLINFDLSKDSDPSVEQDINKLLLLARGMCIGHTLMDQGLKEVFTKEATI